jgi:Fe-S cluster assembly protein SufD
MNWKTLFDQHKAEGLKALRESAIQWHSEHGFPSATDEEWRKINISPITTADYVVDGPSRIESGLLPVANIPGVRLVFVNGRFSSELSTWRKDIKGVKIGRVSEGEALLKRKPFAHAFDALNIAFLTDGAWIRISKGTNVKEPIQLVFVSSSGNQAIASHIRNIIEAEEGSQVTIVETYVGACAGNYLTNTVTDIYEGPNASVRHYKLQKEGIAGFHVGKVSVQQARDSRFFSGAVQLGGAIVRNEIDTVFSDPGAECKLDGLFMASGKQVIDTHTSIDHAHPHCASRELYKGILTDQSRGVFDGKIIVRPDAQKTDARQMSRNLLLSEDALVDSTPRLEIYADDVKCAHGATIGTLDEDAIFYLRTRGMGLQEARSMLTYAFATEILDEIDFEPLRKLVEKDVRAILSGVIR